MADQKISTMTELTELPAIACWVIALILLYVMLGCREYQPFPEGEPTQPPIGYIIHCIENPDSIFCEDK